MPLTTLLEPFLCAVTPGLSLVRTHKVTQRRETAVLNSCSSAKGARKPQRR